MKHDSRRTKADSCKNNKSMEIIETQIIAHIETNITNQ